MLILIEFDFRSPVTVIVSPASPNCVVPQFVLGLILFTFTSLIIYLLKFVPYIFRYRLEPPISRPRIIRITSTSTTATTCISCSCSFCTLQPGPGAPPPRPPVPTDPAPASTSCSSTTPSSC